MRFNQLFSPGSTARLVLTQTAAGVALVTPTTWIAANMLLKRAHASGVLGAHEVVMAMTWLSCIEVVAFCPVLIAPVSAALRQLREAQARLEKLADTDALTGLLNRRGLEKAAGRLSSRAGARGDSVAALLCDIDHFKRVNDLHGHDVGDETLRAVGALLAARFGGDEAVAGRFGGEEFLVIVRVRNPRAAETAAEALREAFAALDIQTQSAPVRCTLSVGVAVAAGGSEMAPLVSRADAALYAAKTAGRNRVRLDGGAARAA